MLRLLKCYQNLQSQALNCSKRCVSSGPSKSDITGPSEPSKENQTSVEAFERAEEDAHLAVKRQQAAAKRKSIVNEEAELSSYDRLKKVYLEKNMNRYDSDAWGTRDLSMEHPWDRIKRVLKNDFKHWHRFFQPGDVSSYGTADFLIVGNGLTASLIAYHLKSALPRLAVTVLEEDAMIGCEPLGINGESLIMQWGMPHYVKMAKYAFDFYQAMPGLISRDSPGLNFTPYGSLLLSNGSEDFDGRCSAYDDINWNYERLTKSQLQGSFPWMNLNGIEEGVHGLGGEGWIDPWKALAYVRQMSMELGVLYTSGRLIDFAFSQVPGVETEDRMDGEVDTPRIAAVQLQDGRPETLDFSALVLASGVRNRYNSLKLHIGNGPGYLQLELPLRIRKRYMFRLRCPDGPVVDLPLIMDPSGFRIRREGFTGHYLCWRDPKIDEEPEISHLDVENSYFENKIRPSLVERIPALAGVEIESSWAGMVDVNEFDGEPIIGIHPSYGTVYLVTGLGSNELVYSPAIAKAASELLLESEYKTVDCSAFLLDRILFDEPIVKPNAV